MYSQGAMQVLTDPIGWLRDALMTWGLENFCGRFYGTYAAVVIDNADPLGRGRVRATCPSINMPDEDDVPQNYWMKAKDGPATDPDTGQMCGMFWPPDVGNVVWVEFRMGDTKFPLYSGGMMTSKNAAATFESPDTFKRGFRTKAGHFIRFDDDPDNLSLMIVRGDGAGEPTPMFFSMDKDGSVQLSNEQGTQLFMDAVNNETTIMNSDGSDVLSMLKLGDDNVLLQTKSGGMFSIDGKEVSITGDNVMANCNKQFYANAGSVKIGANATEPMIRGNRLMTWVLTHSHPHPMGPTLGSVVPVILMNELSEKTSLA